MFYIVYQKYNKYVEMERAYASGKLVESFIIPKVLSKASLITVTNDLIKEVNSLMYRFNWKDNDKINAPLLSMISRMEGLRCWIFSR